MRARAALGCASIQHRAALTPPRLRSADYRTLNFVLSSNVIVFFYSFWMMVADAFRMSGRCVDCGRAPPAQPGASRARPPAAQVEELRGVARRGAAAGAHARFPARLSAVRCVTRKASVVADGGATSVSKGSRRVAGAATALAGLRGGFSDLQLVNYCSYSHIFCRKLVASTVMSYLAWLAMVPSLYINIVENEDGPW